MPRALAAIETGIIKGRNGDVLHLDQDRRHQCGREWEDSKVVADQGVITSRNPGDLEAFSAKIIEEIAEGRHTQRTAA